MCSDKANNQVLMPEVVNFISGGVECIVYIAFEHRGLNMFSVILNLGDNPSVNIEYFPGTVRVTINDGDIWFDTSEESAAAIEHLFRTGKAPILVSTQ